jgi:hypothetical protein
VDSVLYELEDNIIFKIEKLGASIEFIPLLFTSTSVGLLVFSDGMVK